MFLPFLMTVFFMIVVFLPFSVILTRVMLLLCVLAGYFNQNVEM